MVSKSFIAYACLFGFTTSINALRVASDRDSEPPREHDHHHARDPLFGSKLKLTQNIGDLPYPSLPPAFPIPTLTDYPDAVEFRDLEALADRRLHHKHHTKHPHHPKPTSPSLTSPTPVVKNRDLEALADKEFHSGEDFLDEHLQSLVRRLKLSDFLRHSVSAPQPTSTGGSLLKGYRDLGSLDDNLDNSDDESTLTDVQDSQDLLVRRGGPEVTHKPATDKSNKKKKTGAKVVKRPRPTTTTVGAPSPSNLTESKGSKARADHDLASNEGSIDDESQNLDRRIKITSGKSRPAPPPGSDGPDSVVSYRDLEGLVARALADRTFNIDAAIDTVESLVKTLVKGSSGSPSTPGNTAQPSRRRARNCKFFWPALMCEQDVLIICRST
jgi:hypothetical protein